MKLLKDKIMSEGIVLNDAILKVDYLQKDLKNAKSTKFSPLNLPALPAH